jgi:hypothetical protein
MFRDGSEISATAFACGIAASGGGAEREALEDASAPWSSELTSLHAVALAAMAKRTGARSSTFHAIDIVLTLDTK